MTRYFEVVTGSELVPGVIAAIQTFGDRINFHPHLHFLVTEGGVDEAGAFHKITRIDDSRLAELFAREVLAFLVGRVGKYMIRPPLPLEHLSLDEREGKVGYRYGKEASEVERRGLADFSPFYAPLRLLTPPIPIFC